MTLAILGACSIMLAVALPLSAETSPAELPQLIADAAKFESGQDATAIWKIEELLRDSARKPALRAELEAGLAKLLVPTSTFEARRFACQWLAAIGTDASLPAIARLLENDETAGIACLALSTRHTPNVHETLRNALSTARGRTRLQIISALGNHQDAESVGALAKLAADADAAVAEAAIVALGRIGSTAAHEAVAAIRRQAKRTQAAVATEATQRVAEQLAAAGDRKSAAKIYGELLQPKSPTNVRRGALAALLELDEDGGQRRILDTLRDGDAALVPVAIARVASLKSSDASATFAAMLPRLSPSQQMWMIEALAGRSDAAARQAIRAQIVASDAAVRRAAILAVGRLEDASAVPVLVKALAGAKSPEETQDVELALASLRGGAATDQALVGQLKRCSADAKLRLFSIFTRRGARAAVPALLAEAGGSDAETVQAAFRSLGKLGSGDDVPVLLEKLQSLRAAEARSDAETAAARALAKIPDVARRSETARAALAKTTNVESRASLLRLLPSAPDAPALAVVQAAVGDKEASIRDAAVRTLAAWPDATAWNALLAVVARPESGTHRALALRGLVRLAGEQNVKPDAALIERYRQLLASAQNDDERKLVLGALAGAAHPDALQLALPLASNAGVRAEATLAVRKIAAAIKAQHPQAAQKALEQLKRTKP